MLQRAGIDAAVLSRVTRHGLFGARHRIRRFVSPYPVDRGLGYRVYRGREPHGGVGEVVQRFEPSVAVAQAGRPMEMAEALLAAGVPTVVYLRDTEFHQLGSKLRERPALLFLANSLYTARRFHEDYGILPEVIPPIVPPERYATSPERKSVLFVNPVPEKGLDVALHLATSRPDIPFRFVEGWPLSGSGRKTLRARVRRVRNVRLSRHVLDMRPLYRETKLLLVPTQSGGGAFVESWGRVVTEAHCSGIPALASNSGGLPDTVGPGGILVERDSEFPVWEKALARLWDDGEEYTAFSRAARDYSKRPEIRPGTLFSRFRDLVSRHAQAGAAAEDGAPSPESSSRRATPPAV